MKTFALLLASAAAAIAGPLAAQDFAITNATVATGDGSDPVENATVVVRGGRVVAAGTGVAVPAGVETIDGAGSWVTPGLVATVTSLGLWDVGAVSESNDTNAGNSPFSAALDAAPAINPNSQHILVHRAAGVTRAASVTMPASSIFGGQGSIIDLGADMNPITRARAFQVVTLGESGARLAGGSRASTHALFRNALREANQFGEDGQIPGVASRPAEQSTGDDLPIDPRLADNQTERGDDSLLTRFDAAALVPVVRGEQQLYVMVERASDILATLALKRDFPRLDMVRVPGADGLSWGQAFATITSVPAQISGLSGRAGMLTPGGMGDVVMWDGDPLEVGSMPTRVFIDGVEQPLENHQSRLKDRYRDLDTSDLPKGYDW